MVVSEPDDSSLSLDEKLLLFMEQLEQLEQKRANLNSLIEQGWFSMSKARYSMGNKQVSALQYASEIEPLVCVHARALDHEEMVFSTERFTQTKECGKDVGFVEDLGPQEGVRRRTKPKKMTTEHLEGDEASEENVPDVTPVKKSDQSPQQDPLKWFGILVPQSLKQAQASFKQVIELSAEIATLHAAILKSRQELKSGARDKRIPQEETSDEASK